MSDKPRAEFTIDEHLIRGLLSEQDPARSDLPLRKAAEGWDCEVWRLGDDLAVRLPRRSLAAPLIEHEQRVLPLIAPGVEAAGVRLPVPVVSGTAGAGFPWPWSIVPWVDGSSGLSVPRALRTGWAPRLARALRALHVPAAQDYPVNPFRGVPLALRSPAVAARIADLRDTWGESENLDAIESLWESGLDAAAWDHAPVWVHGDLHPGNLIAGNGELRAIIDFGDVTAGDPAYDLAVAWLAFDESGRRRFIAGFGDIHGPATWMRARAWAGAVALMLVAHSDDNPAYAALGADTLHELTTSD